MKKTALFLTTAAIIAALYVVLTYFANLLGLANMAIQVRFSEALTIIPLFTPAAIPGLFIGCIISNTIAGCNLWDIIFGSLTTLSAAALTYVISIPFRAMIKKAESKKTKTIFGILGTVLGSIPPILGNMFVVPLVLIYAYQMTEPIEFLRFTFPLYWGFAITVCLGEIISCLIFGLVVSFVMRRTGLDLKLGEVK